MTILSSLMVPCRIMAKLQKMTTTDIEWLTNHGPAKDLVNAQSKIDYIFSTAANLDAKQLPYTFGLFGSWGSGKTSLLSLLSKDKRIRNYTPVYFNAWKYAGIDDIYSILTYKILTTISAQDNIEKADVKISNVVLALSNKYKNDVGEWLKDYSIVNPFNVLTDVANVKKLVHDQKFKTRAVKEYYTQTDKAQDLLFDFFNHIQGHLLVIIDELDRCDPHEAFDVIKKLRIFFAMRGAPIIFVVSVNPDPIGMAIRHQYGLNDDAGAYESHRILEKFVDDYIDMSQPVQLNDFVGSLWALNDLERSSFVHHLETFAAKKSYEQDTVRHATTLLAISSQNPYYNNLRVLAKSLKYSLKSTPPHKWVLWHLEILKQCHKKLRNDIRKISSDLREVAKLTHISLIHIYFEKAQHTRCIDFSNNAGSTPFSIYRSIFWANARKHLEALKKETDSEMNERREVWQGILADYNVMDFVIQLSLLHFELRKDLPQTVQSLEMALGNFSYELANY